jgi:hypothetical protein
MEVATMAKALLAAWTSPVDDESEAEFNAWYENTHIPQIRAAIPAVTATYRYRAADLPGPAGAQQPAHRYLAVYELDTDDVAGAVAAFGSAKLDLSPALDLTTDPPIVQWYESVG